MQLSSCHELDIMAVVDLKGSSAIMLCPLTEHWDLTVLYMLGCVHLQQDPAMVEQLSKNITRQGLTNYTLNFLRVRHPADISLLK